MNCSDSDFNSVSQSNLYSCRLNHYDGAGTKASSSFSSTDGAVCGGSETLASIMAHADGGNVLNHGDDEPMNSCSRSNGSKGGDDSIVYYLNLDNTESQSMIGDDGLSQTIARMLEEAHGDNYYIAAFINDPSKEAQDCQGSNLEDYYGPDSDQSIYEGKKYKELARLLGAGKMKTFSACMPKYDDAMNFVFDLIVTSANRSYKMELNEKAEEWVYRVKILDSHGIVYTIAKDKFKWDNGLLSFAEGVNLTEAEMIYIDVVIPNPLTLNRDPAEEDKDN